MSTATPGSARTMRDRLALLLAAGFVVALLTNAAPAWGQEPTSRGPWLTLPWLAAQLVPSPELAADPHGTFFGMRWQASPVLYSHGIHRSQSPWRFFVVEPIVRTSGSTELYLSPEYFALRGSLRDRFGLRTGVRSTFPVIERGDYLSLSLGTSWLRFGGEDRVGYEAGAHVLFGFLGALVTCEPKPGDTRWIATLHVRVF